jgi:hypothetical protein
LKLLFFRLFIAALPPYSLSFSYSSASSLILHFLSTSSTIVDYFPLHRRQYLVVVWLLRGEYFMRKQWLKDCGGGESVGGGLIETIILLSFHRRSTLLSLSLIRRPPL